MVVILQSEFGEVIELVADPEKFLEKVLPPRDPTDFPLLRYIDWYGNTIFNRNQMDQFLTEWQRIQKRAQTPQEAELLSRIESLARRVKDTHHRYLKFEGD